MDAASHRGIDDVRILRDAVKLAPANARKKVYIIDEAHMLTVEASNALLKTLEEPPEHVMFIMATTNPEKIINEKIKGKYEEIEKYLSTSLPSNITNLTNHVINRELNESLAEVERLTKKGTSARSLTEKLIEKFRINLLGKMGIGEDTLSDIPSKDLIKLIELLIKANKNLPNAYIE